MADETTESASSAPSASSPEAAEATEGRGNARKVREGTVSSASMDKTVVVKVIERVRHPRYAKTMQHTTKLYAQDDTNECKAGDRVRLIETRPLSKLKRWRVLEILERAK
jgi:small subunit ribosomal protein S17